MNTDIYTELHVHLQRSYLSGNRHIFSQLHTYHLRTICALNMSNQQEYPPSSPFDGSTPPHDDNDTSTADNLLIQQLVDSALPQMAGDGNEGDNDSSGQYTDSSDSESADGAGSADDVDLSKAIADAMGATFHTEKPADEAEHDAQAKNTTVSMQGSDQDAQAADAETGHPVEAAHPTEAAQPEDNAQSEVADLEDAQLKLDAEIGDALRDTGMTGEVGSSGTDSDDEEAQIALSRAIEAALNVPLEEGEFDSDGDVQINSSADEPTQSAQLTESAQLAQPLSSQSSLAQPAHLENSAPAEIEATAKPAVADPALREALEQVAENVVDKNLGERPADDSRLEEQHWDDIMQKAIEMATDHPEALLTTLKENSGLAESGDTTEAHAQSGSNTNSVRSSTLPAAATVSAGAIPGATSSSTSATSALPFSFAQTATDRKSVSALAQSMVNAAISAAALKAAAQQRLLKLTGSSAGAAQLASTAGKSLLSSYQQYVSKNPGTAGAAALTSMLAGLARKGGQRMSIAEMLAAQRGGSTPRPTSRSRPGSGVPRGRSLSLSGQQNLLSFILCRLHGECLRAGYVRARVSDARMMQFRRSVDASIAKVSCFDGTAGSARLNSMDEKQRHRLENRERKKRWRVVNIERNRDSDLRMRVVKRADMLYHGPAQAALRERWIEAEFRRRRNKRLNREKVQQQELLGITPEEASALHKPRPVAEVLRDPSFITNMVALSNALGMPLTAEQIAGKNPDRKLAVTSISVCLLCAHAASTPRFADINIDLVADSIVTSLSSYMAPHGKAKQPVHLIHENVQEKVQNVGNSANDTRPAGEMQPAQLAQDVRVNQRLGVSNEVSRLQDVSATQDMRSVGAIGATGPVDTRIRRTQSDLSALQPAISAQQSSSISPSPDNSHKRKSSRKKQAKKSRSRSRKDEPVDYSMFLSPHPPPASFWTMLRRQKAGELQGSPETQIIPKQEISEAPPTSLNSSPELPAVQQRIFSNRVPAAGISSLPSSTLSAGPSAVPTIRLPRYISPSASKRKQHARSAQPALGGLGTQGIHGPRQKMARISSIPNLIKTRPMSHVHRSVLKRPVYYGIKRPTAFKKPSPFKRQAAGGIRRPFGGIVPIKRE